MSLDPSELFAVWLGNFTVDFLRYAIAASAAFLLFWVWGEERFRARLVNGAFAGRRRMLHDVGWSMSTVLLFSLNGVAVFYAGRAGVLRRYETIDQYGWAWLVLSVVVLLVLQDTYFYWTHRAMHHRLLFKWVHRTHHVSTNPSPFTAYAFSPLEAMVHALFVPLAWFFLPLHGLAVFSFLVVMVLRNVLGHLSIELFPSGFTTNRWWSWSTTTTHHGLHHRYPDHNFGLYFTFWDRVAGTTHPRYERTFEQITGEAIAEDSAPSTEVAENLRS